MDMNENPVRKTAGPSLFTPLIFFRLQELLAPPLVARAGMTTFYLLLKLPT